MRKGPATSFQFDATVMLDYHDIFFIGGGYRNAFGVIGMAGVNVFNMLTIAYAYDYTTQPALAGQVGSTHEITAGFHLASNYKGKAKLRDKDADVYARAKAVVDIDSLTAVQAQNKKLADAVAASNKALDSTTRQLNQLQATNNILQEQNAEYQKLSDSMAKKADQLFTLKDLSNGKKLKGTSYRLDKIYFNYKKYDLLPESISQLDELVGFMRRFPKIHIMVSGYTDTIGGDRFNAKLSLNRAEAVTKYLVQQGISGLRIEYEGKGSSNPVAGNDTEAGRKLNRRVEFTIVKE